MSKSTEHGDLWEAQLEKVRPVVIVSRDDVGGRRDHVTVASVTTTLRDTPVHVAVDHRDGLPHLSMVNCDELYTIPKLRLRRRIGRLSETRIADVDYALSFALGLR